MKTSAHVAAIVACLAIAFGVAAGCSRPATAPDVGYTLLDGSQHRLADLRGQVVLVNFWATTCAPCVREMPKFVETHLRYQSRGFQTLAVAMSYDPPVQVGRFVESRQLPFGIVLDLTGTIARAFGDVQVTPTTVLIDRQGREVKRYVGEPDFAELQRLIDDLLAAA